jgi:ribosome-interacting GTPase 1
MGGLHPMNKHLGKHNLIALFGMIVLLSASVSHAGQAMQVAFLYKLSTFMGKAPVGAWPRIHLDPVNNEIYTLSDEIRVFNKTGMQIYQMASSVIDEKAGERSIIDVAVKKNGDLLFLVFGSDKGTMKYFCVVADFRGEPISASR